MGQGHGSMLPDLQRSPQLLSFSNSVFRMLRRESQGSWQEELKNAGFSRPSFPLPGWPGS